MNIQFASDTNKIQQAALHSFLPARLLKDALKKKSVAKTPRTSCRPFQLLPNRPEHLISYTTNTKGNRPQRSETSIDPIDCASDLGHFSTPKPHCALPPLASSSSAPCLYHRCLGKLYGDNNGFPFYIFLPRIFLGNLVLIYHTEFYHNEEIPPDLWAKVTVCHEVMTCHDGMNCIG